MIENTDQLAATLAYVAKWANTLEGMRRYEEEKGGNLFAAMANGPLNEIRQNLAEARTFLETSQTSEIKANGTLNSALSQNKQLGEAQS